MSGLSKKIAVCLIDITSFHPETPVARDLYPAIRFTIGDTFSSK
jgi:hypothetical protein